MAQWTDEVVDRSSFNFEIKMRVQGRPSLALWPRSVQTCGPVLHQLPTRLSEVGRFTYILLLHNGLDRVQLFREKDGWVVCP